MALYRQLHVLVDGVPQARASWTAWIDAPCRIASCVCALSSAACSLVTQRLERAARDPVTWTVVQTIFGLLLTTMSGAAAVAGAVLGLGDWAAIAAINRINIKSPPISRTLQATDPS